MRLVIGCLVLVLTVSWIPTPASTEAQSVLQEKARAYVAILSTTQVRMTDKRRRGVLRFDHPDRFRWTFLPGRRLGLTLREMTERQRERALAMVREGLSDEGFAKVQGIFDLEAVLQKNLSPSRRRRDPDWRDPLGYTLTVFGDPKSEDVWGWRLGGHHLSLHVTVKDGVVVSGTPFFLGGSPARLSRGPNRGFAPLGAHEDAAFALLESLDGVQRERAVQAPRVPRGFLLQPGRAPTSVKPAGVSGTALTKDQRAKFWTLVESFATTLETNVSDRLLNRARESEPKDLHFVWRGPTVRGHDHYFRVHGKDFVIEHWNQGNHIHSVWRDATDEWGATSLRSKTK